MRLKQFAPSSIARLAHSIGSELLCRHARVSYSQEGEDMILRRIFEHRQTGYYVDVGAHHPKRFSNTYGFYRRGWKGINIDAMPGSMRKFRTWRPHDINLEIPIGSTGAARTYYVFNETALNGFDRILSEQRDAKDNAYKIVDRIPLRTRSLASVLDEFLPPDTGIDFLSIDVEGLDLEVLMSNDWKRYRPTVVLVEALGSRLSEVSSSATARLLLKQGYGLYAKAVNTVIFKLE